MESKIKAIMEEIFELDKETISADLKREDVLLWDSLNHLSFVTALEEAFNIQLTMQEIQSLDSLPRIKETLKKHM